MKALDYYYLYKNQGLCPKCGKREPLEGKVYCSECTESGRKSQQKHRANNIESINRGQREDYAYFKERHICVSCRANKTYFGHARCPECTEKYKGYYSNGKSREYQKQRRERLKAQGLCVSCGKNPTNGYTRCEACRGKYGYLTAKNIGQIVEQNYE